MQIARRGIAFVGAFGQAAPDRPFERLWQRWAQFADRYRFIGDRGNRRLDRRALRECAAAGQQFVQDGAERELISGEIGNFAASLLWRHVARRAENRPGLGRGQ